jgi:CTP:molybdopterin cytidylyltransferase MocA
MVGAAIAPGPAVRLVQSARQEAARDTLEAAEATGLFDQLIVVTNDPFWACNLSVECVVDLDDTRHPFHFGRRLASVIEHYQLTHVLYMGAGAAPLLGSGDLARIAEAVSANSALLVTNNLHSTDWAAFTPASILSEHVTRVQRDNSLGWVLNREGGLSAEVWPPCAASRLDIDTPTDLMVLTRHSGCGVHLDAWLNELDLDTDRLERAMGVLTTEGAHLIVAGRLASSTWSALERETLCWIRIFAEERGMVASGRQAGGQVNSLLGAYLEQVGMDRFFKTMETWADAFFWDNRVVLAHHKLWPSAEDRYASDLGWVDQVKEPLLREMTARTQSASIPIILGGHSLVSGGLLGLLEAART